MTDDDVHDLPPLVRLDEPIPATVWVAKDEEWWPGFCTAWRGNRCHVEHAKGPGMKVLDVVSASDVRRVAESMQPLDSQRPTRTCASCLRGCCSRPSEAAASW